MRKAPAWLLAATGTVFVGGMATIALTAACIGLAGLVRSGAGNPRLLDPA